MIFRGLTQGDVEAIHAIDQRCFPPDIAYSAAEIAAYLTIGADPNARPAGWHEGCELDGRLVAVLLSAEVRKRGHIITVDVDAGVRRQRIGEQLMRHAGQFYRGRGARGMRLEAAVNNAGALAFYARLGYRVVRTLPRYYAEDLDALRLELDF